MRRLLLNRRRRNKRCIWKWSGEFRDPFRGGLGGLVLFDKEADIAVDIDICVQPERLQKICMEDWDSNEPRHSPCVEACKSE